LVYSLFLAFKKKPFRGLMSSSGEDFEEDVDEEKDEVEL
jgi:hypothetical protein